MQKTYSYDPERFKFKVVFSGYILIASVLIFTVLFAMNPSQLLYLFGIGISAYGAVNTFVLKSNPKEIVIDDNSIDFKSFGEVKFDIESLDRFVIKEFANAQFYIRVADNKGKKARFWVSYYYFSDREDLIDELYVIEKRIHPNSLKFRGRKHMFNVRKCNQEKVELESRDSFFDDVVLS